MGHRMGADECYSERREVYIRGCFISTMKSICNE